MTLFSDLKLDANVLKAVKEAGYDAPTPIQAGAIPPALEGRDVLGIAQTGTGKTAGFTLPMITLLGRGRARARMPRSLVLCPTRELAAQVAENFDLYAKYTRLTKALLIGGVSFTEQDKLIDRGVDVLIATPGRLLDHFERGKLLLTGVQIMVVDEADRMLDMGFIPDIERIFQLTPFTRQTLFFSATMAPEIERITNTFLHAPERVEVARQATASENIEQRLIEITPVRKDQTAKQKREVLRALIDAEAGAMKNAIIFSNRKTDVDIVTKSLRAHGYDAAAIHGDLNQSQRTQTLDDFREGRLRFLVASDVAARGLDIPAVSHVFNFDLPSHAEDYVHRIGRTGRAGLTGTAISLSVPSDEKYLSAIENLLKRTLPRAQLPKGHTAEDGRRSTGEGRSPSRSRAARHQQQASDEPAKTASVQPKPQPQAEQPRQQPQQSRENGRDPSAGRNNEHRSRRDSRHDRNRGDNVAGMGDHVPEFLTRNFLDALAATERGDVERAEAERVAAARRAEEKKAADEAAAKAAKEQAAKEAAADLQPADVKSDKGTPAETATDKAEPAKPTTTRRRRSTSKAAKPENADAAPPAAEGAGSSPDQPDTTEEKPAPTPRKRTTTRRKTAAAEAKPAEDTAAPQETATGPTDAAAASEDKPAAKTTTRRTRKPAASTKADEAPAETPVDAESAAETAAEDVKKPAPRKTTRRTTTRSRASTAKTAEKADEQPAEAAPVEDTGAKAETDPADSPKG